MVTYLSTESTGMAASWSRSARLHLATDAWLAAQKDTGNSLEAPLQAPPSKLMSIEGLTSENAKHGCIAHGQTTFCPRLLQLHQVLKEQGQGFGVRGAGVGFECMGVGG